MISTLQMIIENEDRAYFSFGWFFSFCFQFLTERLKQCYAAWVGFSLGSNIFSC